MEKSCNLVNLQMIKFDRELVFAFLLLQLAEPSLIKDKEIQKRRNSLVLRSSLLLMLDRPRSLRLLHWLEDVVEKQAEIYIILSSLSFPYRIKFLP